MLFRRREVWLPTWSGWALLLALAVLSCAVLGWGAYPLLAPEHPARGPDGHGARTLVVEGWMMDDELREAAGLARSGHYERVLTTGGPLPPSYDAHGWHNYAMRAAAVLRDAGVTDVPVIAVPVPVTTQERTYTMALAVRTWAQLNGVALTAIDLASRGAHMRRSAVVYRLALGPTVEVGTRVVRPSDYDPVRWWTSSEGAKATLDELFGLAWTECCFWP